ncbi:MAG: sigma-70 family RNA polymerase sigma factor [Phycisphaerales bacterium]|nr:sigma-70 family RNA polymerase sigma factor [Phycisphaerales bacterium]
MSLIRHEPQRPVLRRRLAFRESRGASTMTQRGSMSTNPVELRQLETAASQGDESALRSLLLQHGPAVERRLEIPAKWRAVLDTADVMQVTYLEAFLHISRYDPSRGEPFARWLGRIADNNLLDAIRALSRQKQPQPERRIVPKATQESMVALVELLGATTTTPSQEFAANEACARLSAAVQALPDSYRIAVQMYDLEGRSIEDVAAALGKSAGAVHMLRARAHDRLRELLGTTV